MDIFAEIKGIGYQVNCANIKRLNEYSIDDLEKVLQKEANFILSTEKGKIAVSWWVSPKRTRSYPYARVYDTLGFIGKKVTIIPIIKDEGKDGDRDFLQWDTISLMSLLGVHVIIGYYADADSSSRYKSKITNQRFDSDYIKEKIHELLSYHSDALHWNLEQINNILDIAEKAIKAYERISRKLGVKLHSIEKARSRIEKLYRSKEEFLKSSRDWAHRAQLRESTRIQPKEKITGIKANLTIKNYLGGYYYFTCDEVEIHDGSLYLIEAKHTQKGDLPAEGDIKDGLIRMMLYTNFNTATIDGYTFNVIPVLKLTTNKRFNEKSLKGSKLRLFNHLKVEAEVNKFKLKVNDTVIV